MKRTFRVELRNVPFLETLMNHFKWEEIDRVATGGMMSQPELLITFGKTLESSPLNPFKYIEVKQKFSKNSIFYSIDEPNGREVKDVEQFFDGIRVIEKLEIKEYNDKKN